MRNHRHYFLFLIVLGMLFFLFFGCSNRSSEPAEEPEQEPDETEETTDTVIANYDFVPENISPISGEDKKEDLWPIMVQLENTPAARPHSGISAADLIYEIEVEYNITRLTTFYQNNIPDKVGNARSTRRQHIHLWSEWNYLYAFYGGSTYRPNQNIYDLMEELDIKAPRLDGTFNSSAFYRSGDRKAPHNAYIELSSFKDQTYKPESVRSFYFDSDTKPFESPANTVEYAYRSDNKIAYEYDSSDGLYFRSINGEAMIDAENGQPLAFDNVIFQKANHYAIEGTPYTNIDLVGEGTIHFIRDGSYTEGTWERTDFESPTVYYDEKGEKIPFKPGKTFIQIVRNNADITIE
ncbi:MAG TPA: hypothetical protein DHN33_07480 [Eubacteriaceae bacterium]|nr:hypothetical protein [Eubacteriaceae bacterium]